MNWLAQGVADVTELFFPKLCNTCNARLLSQETYLCLNCWQDLPTTNFHTDPDNKVARLFWGRVVIENATSFFAYKKGSKYQHLIHAIKYRGLKELGFESGQRFASALMDSKGFSALDIIVPVPLHPGKEKKRGFNQSDHIAEGMGNILNKPISKGNMYRCTDTATQTNKNRFERWQNVEGIFDLKNPDEFIGKHILLVDDVITTGSTLEACAYHLLKLKNTKVSIATLAFADY